MCAVEHMNLGLERTGQSGDQSASGERAIQPRVVALQHMRLEVRTPEGIGDLAAAAEYPAVDVGVSGRSAWE